MLKYIPALLFLTLCLSSCQSVALKMYGMRAPKALSTEEIISLADEYHIPARDNYILNEETYLKYVKSLDKTRYKNSIHDHLQPLQVLYYDSDGDLQSFQVNCYAGGFPNLKWNRDGAFEVFLPKKQAPLDSIIPLHLHRTFLSMADETIGEFNEFRAPDYTVIVHWNRFMGRQSKRLIKLVQKNTQLAEAKSVRVIYVNTDNLFATLAQQDTSKTTK